MRTENALTERSKAAFYEAALPVAPFLVPAVLAFLCSSVLLWRWEGWRGRLGLEAALEKKHQTRKQDEDDHQNAEDLKLPHRGQPADERYLPRHRDFGLARAQLVHQ